MTFNLHFAGSCSKERDQHLKNVGAYRLFSQLTEKSTLERWEASGYGNRLIIDSGAFSVAHNNSTVDIDEYIRYINRHTEVAVWVELDVIPFPILNNETALRSCELSWSNYVYMRERLPPNLILLPLYHFGEPKFALTRILNTAIDGNLPTYIGVGGRHGVSTQEQIKYFEWVFDVIKHSHNPNVRVHAFGITTPQILEKFPFYSADSTAWIKAAAFGEIMLRHTLSRVPVSKETCKYGRNIAHASELAFNRVEEDVRYFGYTIEQLAEDVESRRQYNIDAMYEWSQHCGTLDRKVKSTKRLFSPTN